MRANLATFQATREIRAALSAAHIGDLIFVKGRSVRRGDGIFAAFTVDGSPERRDLESTIAYLMGERL